ncbi:sigma 54-interacting transcriptional regulator [Polyangium sorediatum]|uniref:Sigma 54-interacting transcriptional regulator n=1 Tax=Polyangium sorediatum TaxID=889274 RepID=A0ABT6NYG2_9BACT|nr:sigma 54-interacting transcriptional regulator [Polyangium sorediatum]MDI1433387.1 sigma 54-interacting transcriptional regulator [Polyangium sorediatum]
MPHLIVYEPGQGPVAVPLDESLIVGRDAQCDLLLGHQPVSRQHAHFEHGPDGFTVRDLGSANGTFVNGVRIEESKLLDGHHIHIGPVTLVFQAQEAPEIIYAQPALSEATIELGPPNKRLTLLYALTRTIGALDEPDVVIGRMLEAILQLAGGERAMVALGDGADGAPHRRLTRGRSDSSLTDEIVVSRTIMHALVVRRESVIVRDGRTRDAPRTLARQGILSAMGAPLEVAGRVLGFLYVDDRSREERFGTEDLDFLNALARLLAAALDAAERYQRARVLAEATSGHGPLHDIVGQSSAIQKLRVQVARCAAAQGAHVLIRGESGTGKELVARALHVASPRSQRPLIAVNCAAIPDTMLEGALFGYEKGAFTGAVQSRRGQFVLAHQGTLLLDEIGDLSLSAQAKVLRVLQEGELLPLGAEVPLHVDVRVLAATHKDLRREIAEGRFREDLYYRLNVLQIDVPPLRERDADITLLAQTFLEAAALNLGKRLTGFSPGALAALTAYAWPGNVRELKNEVERAVIHAEGPSVELDDLSVAVGRALVSLGSPATERPDGSLASRFAALEPTERALVEEALAAARGNIAEAARLLGITRIMMRRRVERFSLRGRDS